MGAVLLCPCWALAWRRFCVALALCCGLSQLAAAHPMPESQVWIDVTERGVQLTLQLPLNRLEFAFGQDLSSAPDQVLVRHQEALARYLLLHLGARSGDRGWQVLRPQLSVLGDDASAELHVVVPLLAPAGVDRRQLTLLYSVITHEVRTHRAQVFLRNDWGAGQVGEPPVLLGELDSARTALPLSLARPGRGSALLHLLQAGARHMAEGADHVLFFILLLVVVPLTPAGWRWSGVRETRPALRHSLVVVSAFTVGHSVTLALGSLGWVQWPEQPVEIAVALTIVLAACHAWRPLWAQGEAWMALLLGCVHGLAFSASLSGAGLTQVQHALALLCFNLGIEAMQLLLLVLLLPPMLISARRDPGLHAWLRRVLAGAGLVIALLWVLERTTGTPWLPEASASLWPWAGLAAVAALWGRAAWTVWLRPPARAGSPAHPN